MKIRRILSVFLLTVLMVSLMLTPQAYALPALEIKAKAAVLVDADEGRIIFGQNEQEREYPASITKVMTALLTLEAVDAGKLSLDQPITASAVVNDQDPEGSSAGIEEGEVLTVEQLLYCLLLVSANEAADILAETVSGSREAFVELMNQRAQELGCTGTHFANTNGLHDVNHYTTAYDIYLFFREAMKHETFMTITGSVAYEVPATNKSEARELHTTNSLLSNWRILDYLYDGVDCGKTGSTPEAGYCLVSSCLRDGKRLVAVVLGAEGEGTHIESFSESARLYDYGYDNFSKQLVVSTEDVFRQPVALSKQTDTVMLYPAQSVEAFLPKDAKDEDIRKSVTLKEDVVNAPITAGQELGTLTSGDFVLDENRRVLLKAGQPIELTQVEFQIMELFFRNPGIALVREKILKGVWGENYFGDVKIVDVNIRRLRMKVEDEPSHPTHIMTVWGYGYRWEE